KWIKLSSVALLSLYLAACNADEEVVEEDSTELVEEESNDDHEHEDDDHEHEDDDHGHEDDDHGHEDDDHGHEDDDHEHEDDDHDHDDHDDHAHSEADVEESVEIEGVAHHYHTGELIELTAILEEDNGYDDWHWYTREDESGEWEIVSGQHSHDFVAEAPEESMEIRAVLYDDAHAPFAQSSPVEIEVDNH
ncbi:MAG: hypothetical protein JJU01_02035, partial [Alkalibacterium sp.]|nr:hypothetical protein [Alkalibacterium sp.]